MESSIGKLIYCCVSRNNRIVYSFNGGDHTLEALASLCIEKTPPFHSHYFHTAGDRTFGFLIDGTLTCFAIVDHDRDRAPSSPSKRKILQLLQQIKSRFKKSSNFDDELVPIIKRLICSLESMNHSNHSNNLSSEPLMQEKSLNFESRNREMGRRLWWRHVKIVVAADLLLCLALFGVWLGICRGFRCVS